MQLMSSLKTLSNFNLINDNYNEFNERLDELSLSSNTLIALIESNEEKIDQNFNALSDNISALILRSDSNLVLIEANKERIDINSNSIDILSSNTLSNYNLIIDNYSELSDKINTITLDSLSLLSLIDINKINTYLNLAQTQPPI